jgi:hypothetical protein
MSQSYDLKKAIVSGLHDKLSNSEIVDIHEDILDALKLSEDVITESEIELLKNDLDIQERFFRKIKDVVSEAIIEKRTNAKMSWEDMMKDLSSSINKPIILDDAGNYNVCECEPYHISIRPIVHDIFDIVAIKDGTDRTKLLSVKYNDLKTFVKKYLSSDDMNYVDSSYQKVVDNSKDKEGGSVSNDIEKDLAVNSKGTLIKSDVADDMNNEKDDPDQQMTPIDKFEKMVDYPETKVKYSVPTLPKDLQKLVVKYGRVGRGRPRKK